MKVPDNFAVLGEMSRRNLHIYMSDEVVRVQKTKAGTLIEVGVGGDFIGRIANGEIACCLLLWNKGQFRDLKSEMAEEPGK